MITLDWYDNDVPLRLNHLPSFLTGARYSAVDGRIPSWIALYDIDDTQTFQHESYTRLRANRSVREASLVKKLSVLDRRTYEHVYDSGESKLKSSLKPDDPTPFIVTCGVTLGDAEIQSWASGIKEKVKTVKGWVRTRVFLCLDNLKTGMSVPDDPVSQVVPKYLILHGEFRILSWNTVTHKNTIEFVSKVHIQDNAVDVLLDVVDIRSWELYRAYPCVAQGNLPL